jgi:hypothetical protein
MSQIPEHTVTLLHLYEDDHGDTHLGTRDIAIALRDFAPPATPFDVSEAQPASQFVMIRLPGGWIGESHASPRPQVLFCLSGRLKITCSSGETAIIEAGVGLAMSDVNGRGHKTEVVSLEPVSAIIIQ